MRMRYEAMTRLFASALCCGYASNAGAKPEGPALFCMEYPQAPACGKGQVDCTFCHVAPPQLNDYGQDVRAALETTPGYETSAYESRLVAALRSVATMDSDRDGTSNAQEIAAGGLPSFDESLDSAGATPVWEAETAYRRVGALFCGQTPSFEQNEAFSASDDKAQAVHDLLRECLASDFWQGEALHRLADAKIKPLKVVGIEGSIILADYGWDYRLFSHVLTDDRDARDLLLANYHVTEKGEVTTDPIPRQRAFAFGADLISIGTGQPLKAERRAGMITTQWFLVMNTMFSRLPRTTAAQAYRAYLGLDIAASQGLVAVEGEPRDVDGKGVTAPACAACHSTLDPLAYAFSTYNGIAIGSQIVSLENLDLLFTNRLGAYNATREPWESDGHLFGEPVVDLMQWAKLASETDAFKQNLTQMFYHYALGRDPTRSEQPRFEQLWSSLEADGYSANRLLHRLVDEPVFGSL